VQLRAEIRSEVIAARIALALKLVNANSLQKARPIGQIHIPEITR
jgi:hypothetical protein